jgi:hypothetical protein
VGALTEICAIAFGEVTDVLHPAEQLPFPLFRSASSAAASLPRTADAVRAPGGRRARSECAARAKLSSSGDGGTPSAAPLAAAVVPRAAVAPNGRGPGAVRGLGASGGRERNAPRGRDDVPVAARERLLCPARRCHWSPAGLRSPDTPGGTAVEFGAETGQPARAWPMASRTSLKPPWPAFVKGGKRVGVCPVTGSSARRANHSFNNQTQIASFTPLPSEHPFSYNASNPLRRGRA